MSQLTVARSSGAIDAPWPRLTARWMATFVGFPAGGLAATLLVGPVDSPRAALVGGLVTGSVLGAAQLLGVSRNRPPVGPWIAATAIGLMVGLGIAAAAVDYATSLAALVVQGAVCGFAIGVGQAVVLRQRLRRRVLAWPPALGAIWAVGWAVTTAIGVDVDQQFTVFGAGGALVVTALTLVLPFALDRSARNGS